MESRSFFEKVGVDSRWVIRRGADRGGADRAIRYLTRQEATQVVIYENALFYLASLPFQIIAVVWWIGNYIIPAVCDALWLGCPEGVVGVLTFAIICWPVTSALLYIIARIGVGAFIVTSSFFPPADIRRWIHYYGVSPRVYPWIEVCHKPWEASRLRNGICFVSKMALMGFLVTVVWTILFNVPMIVTLEFGFRSEFWFAFWVLLSPVLGPGLFVVWAARDDLRNRDLGNFRIMVTSRGFGGIGPPAYPKVARDSTAPSREPVLSEGDQSAVTSQPVVMPSSGEGFVLGQQTAISPDQRKGHTHVLGMTGMGKSKALESWIMQDIEAGRGVGVIDPHGSLVKDLLKRLVDVPGIARRLILIDPLDDDFVVGLNPLDRLPGETYQRHAHVLIEIFAVIWENWETSRWLQEYSRYSAWAMAESGWTMVEIIRFLEDEKFRQWIRGQIESPPLRRWVDGYYNMSKGKQEAESRSTKNRIRDFADHEHLRQIIGQRKTTIDFREVLEGEDKVLLVNLRSTDLWGGAYELLGSLIMTLLQLAAFRRGDIGSDDRRRFYLYVDEFHTFANETFVKMMGQIRKYGLTLTLANQDLSQLDRRVEGLYGAVMGNCANTVCFQVGHEDAQPMTQRLFTLTGKMTKEERRRWRMMWKIPIPETDRKYYRLSEEQQLHMNVLMGMGEDGLLERDFVYRGGSQRIAQKDKTVFVPDGTASHEEMRDMIRESVRYQGYARRRDEVGKELAQRPALIKQLIEDDDEDDDGPVLREEA